MKPALMRTALPSPSVITTIESAHAKKVSKTRRLPNATMPKNTLVTHEMQPRKQLSNYGCKLRCQNSPGVSVPSGISSPSSGRRRITRSTNCLPLASGQPETKLLFDCCSQADISRTNLDGDATPEPEPAGCALSTLTRSKSLRENITVSKLTVRASLP